jgi:chromosome segregation ATPase
MKGAHQIYTQQTCIHNQSIDQMDTKFAKLQSELNSHAAKTDRANKMLQTSMRQLAADSRNMQVDIQAEQASLKSRILEMSKQLNEIRDAIQSIAMRDDIDVRSDFDK